MKLVHGDLAPVDIAWLRVHFVDADAAKTLRIDAFVEEQDRHLVLTSPPEVIELHGDPNPLHTLTRAHESVAHELGTVFVPKRAKPHRLCAVVVDVDADDICTYLWVRDASVELIRIAGALGAEHVRTPLLGTVHGKLPLDVASAAIADACFRATSSAPPQGAWPVMQLHVVGERAWLPEVAQNFTR